MSSQYAKCPSCGCIKSNRLRLCTNCRQIVRNWNAKYPPGTPVHLVNDDGQVEHTATRSEAWLLDSGAPVVKVDGRTGGYLLTRITPDLERRYVSSG